jgi:hypothetical protein
MARLIPSFSKRFSQSQPVTKLDEQEEISLKNFWESKI